MLFKVLTMIAKQNQFIENNLYNFLLVWMIVRSVYVSFDNRKI